MGAGVKVGDRPQGKDLSYWRLQGLNVVERLLFKMRVPIKECLKGRSGFFLPQAKPFGYAESTAAMLFRTLTIP